ncbi:MAG: hypothetical protein IJ744_05765 [Lachnospiraceae bacterium]|nr:hypothetical protein [Lachnospiraceae bacterium]
MDQILLCNLLISRKKHLERLLKKSSKGSQRPNQFKLCVRGGKKYHKYYIYDQTQDTIHYQYMPLRRRKEVAIIAQQEYEQDIYEAAGHELHLIERYLDLQEGKNVDNIYDRLCDGRKLLITPLDLPDDQFVEQWQAQKFDTTTFYADQAYFTTDRGEKVRSKSELMIANALAKNGVPYHYEPSLTIGMRSYRPDFLVLNKKRRKEYYWEHLGMMGNGEYAGNATHKLLDYQNAGLYIGENVILTAETSFFPLTTEQIQQTIDHYLL